MVDVDTPLFAGYGLKNHPWLLLCGIKSARATMTWLCGAFLSETCVAVLGKVVIEALLPRRYIQASCLKFFQVSLGLTAEYFCGYSNCDQWFWTYRSTDFP